MYVCACMDVSVFFFFFKPSPKSIPSTFQGCLSWSWEKAAAAGVTPSFSRRRSYGACCGLQLQHEAEEHVKPVTAY